MRLFPRLLPEWPEHARRFIEGGRVELNTQASSCWSKATNRLSARQLRRRVHRHNSVRRVACELRLEERPTTEETELDENLRLNYHLRTDGTLLSNDEGEIPPPPHLVRHGQLLYFLCEFDRELLEGLLPSELKPAPTNTGMFCFYSAPDGRGLTPYSAWFAGVNVVGHDSPDGNFATYIFTGCFSDRAGEVFPSIYNARIRPGWTRQTWAGAYASGEAGTGSEPIIRMAARIPPGNGRPTFGLNHYLGRHPKGGIVFYSVAISCQMIDVEPTALDILEHAPEDLRRFQPKGFVNTFAFADCSLTFSLPRLVTDAPELAQADSRRVSLLDALSRMGRAAVILGRSGEVLHLNYQAEELLPPTMATTGKPFRASRPSENARLRNLTQRASAAQNSPDGEALALSREGQAHALIVQAMRLDNEVTGEPAVLLLFTDPMSDQKGQPSAGLQLLGLTPGEARVAAFVGGGRSVKEAAQELEIAESTVRSVLKIAYEKLGIGKQSELGKIVARLEGVGF
jgi:DNA-binding CsgD family transcriptional regulator